MKAPLWEPSYKEKENTLLTKFSKKIQIKYNLPDIEYSTLHKWSVKFPELFWEEAWYDCGVVYSIPWQNVMSKKKNYRKDRY